MSDAILDPVELNERDSRPERAGPATSNSTGAALVDRAVGVTAGGVVCAIVSASVVLAHFDAITLRVALVLAWCTTIAIAARLESRSTRPTRSGTETALASRASAAASNKPQTSRPQTRPARRRRRRSFVATAAVGLFLFAAVITMLSWSFAAAIPGVLAGAAIALGRRHGVSLRPGRPLRWVPVLAIVVASPFIFSLETALAASTPDSLGVRTVEWMRDNGGASIVDEVEHWWYTRHAPPVGGVPATLPSVPGTVPAGGSSAAAPSVNGGASLGGASLPPVQTPAVDALPGEGQWSVVAGSDAHPAVATTFVRPDALHTSLVVGIMRIDPSQVNMKLIAGTQQPGGAAPSNGAVPIADRSSLIAAFNAGFRMQDANGGWFSSGRTAIALRDGAASLVLRDNGTADVGTWGRDDTMTPNVSAVRQNLALLVDKGQLVPGTDDSANVLWGKTVGHRVLVARSGVGVTADGALVYVGGPGLSVETLGRTLLAAGAVRGMEMDINTSWVNAYTYVPSGSGHTNPAGTKLVDSMVHGPERYLGPQTRDFIEVTLKTPR